MKRQRHAGLLAALAVALLGRALCQEPAPSERKDPFPLTRDRCGTLGAPPSKAAWDALGARWFKSGDCYQGM